MRNTNCCVHPSAVQNHGEMASPRHVTLFVCRWIQLVAAICVPWVPVLTCESVFLTLEANKQVILGGLLLTHRANELVILRRAFLKIL